MEGIAAARVSEQVAKAIGLKDNQIVRGIIEDRGGLLKLVLNNRELDWDASKRFKPGDRIDFRVESSIYGRSLRPVLGGEVKVASTAVPVPPALGASPRLLSLLYRPVQPSTVNQLFRPPTMAPFIDQLAAANIRQSADQLITSMQRITPDAVRSGLLSSGLFGEYMLMQQGASRPDLKQFLRSLLKATAPNQTRAIAELTGAIDEIESRQIEGLQAQQNREVSYHFVLPFFDANPVSVHIEREANYAENPEADWVINLHTETDSLGELWLKTTLKANSQVEMIFWADRPGSVNIARAASADLKRRLADFGLELSKLTLLDARRPSIDASLSGPGQVVDVRT
jgi:hypothetical protein